MSTYDWSQFHVHMYYRAPLDAVFAAWATPNGLASFFLSDAVFTDAAGRRRGGDDLVVEGDHYEWTWLHPFRLAGEVIGVDAGREVSFTFGTCAVRVAFRRVDDATEVSVHQTNCATNDPERAWQHLNCRSCWIYFLTNLKSVLEHGVDLRDRAAPEWNDSVSIGWTPPV